MWIFIGNNAPQIQTIIALIGVSLAAFAILYSKMQIKLFKAQRVFELKLLYDRHTDSQISEIRHIESRVKLIRKVHKERMEKGFVNQDFKEKFNAVVTALQPTDYLLKELLNTVELLSDSVNNSVSFDIKEYESSINETLKLSKKLREQSKKVDRILESVQDLSKIKT